MLHHPDLINHSTNVYSNSKIKRQIHNLTYFNKKIPSHIENISEEIRLQIAYVYNTLKPLEDIGIHFNLWLVGGSVRDLLLGKESFISDLDILVSFDYNVTQKKITSKKFIKYYSLDLEKYKHIAWPDNKLDKSAFSHWVEKTKRNRGGYRVPYGGYSQITNSTKMFYDMVYFFISKSFDIYSAYPPSSNNINLLDNLYSSSSLNGVLKIKNDSFKWKMDILLTSTNPMSFLKRFDFGICKAGIEMVNSDCSKRDISSFPEDSNEFFKRVRLDSHFIRDVEDKCISFDINQGSIRDLKNSIENHLPKILSKYELPVKFPTLTQPDSSVNSSGYGGYGNEEYEKNLKTKNDFVSAYFLNKKLIEELGDKKTFLKHSLNKI